MSTPPATGDDDLRTDVHYWFPHPGRPGLMELQLGRVEPMDLGNPEGICRVVMVIDARTAEQAQAFRRAVLQIARDRDEDEAPSADLEALMREWRARG